jgi:hypothetical protein
MTDDGVLLDRHGIEDAFRRLGDRLARRGVVADVYVFGGAAMSLVYDSRRATRDIDAVFAPDGVVIEEARAVADELGLPRWWLNNQASAYIAPGAMSPLPGSSIILDCEFRLPPGAPVAMKVLAGRRRDADDIRVLIAHMVLSRCPRC